MPVNLKGRSFLTLKDFTPDEIRYMLNLAADLKAKKRAGIRGNLLAGKNIVLLFEKTSTRTRCAFEVAAYDEGANIQRLGRGTTRESLYCYLVAYLKGFYPNGNREDMIYHKGVENAE